MPHVDPTRPAPDHRARRRGAIAAGLLALPIVGSVLAGCGTAAADPVTAAATTPGASGSTRVEPGTAPAAPAALGGAPAAAPVAQAPAPGTATGTTPSDEQFVQAFLDAGYSFQDALDLSYIWRLDGDSYTAKVKAGSFLIGGQPLTASPLATPENADGLRDEDLITVFAEHGYGADEADLLAQAWGVDLSTAKIKGGYQLVAVGVLPFVDAADLPIEESMIAFLNAGYDYDDAVRLAEYWGLAGPAAAKSKAGSLLISGQGLPVVPGVEAGVPG